MKASPAAAERASQPTCIERRRASAVTMGILAGVAATLAAPEGHLEVATARMIEKGAQFWFDRNA